MCRNIKTLYNFEPPATGTEIRAAALQFVRKISGFSKPSLANGAACEQAVESIAQVVEALFNSLVTNASAKNRETEEAKQKARTRQRFGR